MTDALWCGMGSDVVRQPHSYCCFRLCSSSSIGFKLILKPMNWAAV